MHTIALLVDNNEDKRFLLTRFLRRAFPLLDVRSCPTVAAAGEFLRNANLGLLITNGRIGTDDGLNFIREVRADRPALPIIMVSLREEMREQAFAAGATGFAAEDDPGEITRTIELALSDHS